MEGFGLPALEALALVAPVLVSDIPIFHEIVGQEATYFNPKDPTSVCDALSKIHKPQATIRKKSLETYSWCRMAVQTLEIYKRAMVP